MQRSPLPAAAASHTASHVSLPLFFFFLTSARGGAATARPLTSPPLARPRPGWGRGEGAARELELAGAQGGLWLRRGGDGESRGGGWTGKPSEAAFGARNLEHHRARVGVAWPRCPAWDESTLLPLKAMGLRLPDCVSKREPREVRREESLPGFAHRVWFPLLGEGWIRSVGWSWRLGACPCLSLSGRHGQMLLVFSDPGD